MTLKSIVGEKYGKLTVLEEGEIHINKKSYTTVKKWVCKCECGNIVEIRQDSLRNGNTKSCGCLVRESRRKRMKN